MLTPIIIAACTWANPGADPYTGRVPAAVESYTDIPADVRAKLRARMERHAFDDVATITRDAITGQHDYTDLRGMHFGAGKVCQQVDRSAWRPEHVERGLVYCEAEHCLIVPTVCNNVSRVTRLARREAPAAAAVIEPLAGGGAAAEPASFAALASPDLQHLQPVATPAAPAPLPAVRAVDWPPPPIPWGFAPPPPVIVVHVPGIPEPGTWAMLLAGLAALALRRR